MTTHAKTTSNTVGEFEHVLLLALLQLGNNAYGGAIRREISDRLDKDISIGAIYTGFSRLEKRQLVDSYLGEATPERGGRQKRFFRVTSLGRETILNSQAIINKMSDGLNLSTA